jgi:hypothetical protein
MTWLVCVCQAPNNVFKKILLIINNNNPSLVGADSPPTIKMRSDLSSLYMNYKIVYLAYTQSMDKHNSSFGNAWIV